MSVKIGILAANQPATAKARTSVERDVAVEMVRRMMAEKLTARLIRLFPADSVFQVLKPNYQPAERIHAGPLAPAELPGLRFIPPPGFRHYPQPADWTAA